MKRLMLLMCGVGLAGASGCTTVGMEQQRQQDMRLAHEVSELRITVNRIESRLAGLVSEQEVLGQDVEQLRVEMRQSGVRHEAGLSSLSFRLDEQVRAQSAMRKELTEDLSSRMAAILQAQARTATAPRTAATGPRAQTGYEHEVKPGETLSEIARAYGVTSAAIIEANQLGDPDRLRAGQKLFIPERGR